MSTSAGSGPVYSTDGSRLRGRPTSARSTSSRLSTSVRPRAHSPVSRRDGVISPARSPAVAPSPKTSIAADQAAALEHMTPMQRKLLVLEQRLKEGLRAFEAHRTAVRRSRSPPPRPVQSPPARSPSRQSSPSRATAASSLPAADAAPADNMRGVLAMAAAAAGRAAALQHPDAPSSQPRVIPLGSAQAFSGARLAGGAGPAALAAQPSLAAPIPEASPIAQPAPAVRASYVPRVHFAAAAPPHAVAQSPATAAVDSHAAPLPGRALPPAVQQQYAQHQQQQQQYQQPGAALYAQTLPIPSAGSPQQSRRRASSPHTYSNTSPPQPQQQQQHYELHYSHDEPQEQQRQEWRSPQGTHLLRPLSAPAAPTSPSRLAAPARAGEALPVPHWQSTDMHQQQQQQRLQQQQQSKAREPTPVRSPPSGSAHTAKAAVAPAAASGYVSVPFGPVTSPAAAGAVNLRRVSPYKSGMGGNEPSILETTELTTPALQLKSPVFVPNYSSSLEQRLREQMEAKRREDMRFLQELKRRESEWERDDAYTADSTAPAGESQRAQLPDAGAAVAVASQHPPRQEPMGGQLPQQQQQQQQQQQYRAQQHAVGRPGPPREPGSTPREHRSQHYQHHQQQQSPHQSGGSASSARTSIPTFQGTGAPGRSASTMPPPTPQLPTAAAGAAEQSASAAFSRRDPVQPYMPHRQSPLHAQAPPPQPAPSPQQPIQLAGRGLGQAARMDARSRFEAEYARRLERQKQRHDSDGEEDDAMRSVLYAL